MKPDYAAQCRFFTAEDACRISLQAYYAAARRIEPPAGEAWMIDGEPYASAGDFADAFNGELQARVALLSLQKLGSFDVASTAWDLYKLAAEIEPEKMSPIIAERDALNARIEAEFLGDTMNRLPPQDNQVHNRESEGVRDAC